MRTIGFIAALVLLLPAAAGAAVFETREFRLDLYSSFELEYQIEDEGNGDPNGSFDSDQIDLAFNYRREDLRIAIDLVIEHGVETEEDRGNIALSFGFVEYVISDPLRVKAGKYFTPFGYHNEHLTVRTSFLTVKEPWSTNKPGKLTESGYRFFPRRQVGVGFLGNAPAGRGSVEYDVFVSNGEQEETNPFEEDDNDEKALTARLNFIPGTQDNFVIGLSTYFDRLTDGDTLATQSSAGLLFSWEPGRWLVRSEVVLGEIDAEADRGSEQQGAYLDLGYRIGRFTPYFEYQTIETEIADRSERGEAFIAGVFVRLVQSAALKVENGYFSGSDDNPLFDGIPGRDYNEVKVGFVVGF